MDATVHAPPEVLAAIFLLVRDISLARKESSTAWLNVSWVCRRWRDIALRLPFLWTHLRIYGPELGRARARVDHVTAYLQRSSGFDLDIVLGLCGLTRQLLDLLKPHLHRTSIASVDYPIDRTLVQEMVDGLGAKLGSLSLDCDTYIPPGDLLLASPQSSLHFLHVRGPLVHFSSSMNHLTHLILIRQRCRNSVYRSLAAYLSSLLSYCPILEVLVMELLASPNPSDFFNDALKFVPSTLSELVIREALSDLPRMVHLVNAPPSIYTHLEVVCYKWKDWEEGNFLRDDELPIFLDLCTHQSQKASSSEHPFDRIVLVVGADETSIVSLAAYSGASQRRWSMVVLLDANWFASFGKPEACGFDAVCPTVLNELATIGMSVEPAALEIHITPSIEHFGSPGLWLAMSRAYPHVMKLSIGCANPLVIRELLPVLSHPGSFPALKELSLCVAQWRVVESERMRQCLEDRLSQGSPTLELVEFVISMAINDMGSLAAVISLVRKLPSSLRFAINREGCPTCHRAFTERDAKMWNSGR